MTGPQQYRPSPTPRGTVDEAPGSSPRPRHGRDDRETGDGLPASPYPDDGYPDLRPPGPVERPAPWTRGGYPDPPLYGEYGGPETGADPARQAGYAAPTRYDGYDVPEQAGVAQQGADAQSARVPRQYDATTRHATASPYVSAGSQPAVPAQRDPAEAGSRPTTVAEAAAARGFVDRGPDDRAADPSRPVRAAEVRVAKDPRALTVLRVLTYILVSLCCLVFLAGAVYAGISYYEFRAALTGTPFGGLGG